MRLVGAGVWWLGPLVARAAPMCACYSFKDRRAKKIINDKKLDIDFKAITFGTYGAFGSSTHTLIKKATADAQESVFCPWVAPGPRQHAYLLFGFSLARANARMLINADSKRRSARNSVRTSRPQSASAATVHG